MGYIQIISVAIVGSCLIIGIIILCRRINRLEEKHVMETWWRDARHYKWNSPDCPSFESREHYSKRLMNRSPNHEHDS